MTSFRLRSQDGIALVQVLVVGAILATVAITMMAIQYHRNKMMASVQSRHDLNEVGRSIRDTAAQAESLIATEELDWATYTTP